MIRQAGLRQAQARRLGTGGSGGENVLTFTQGLTRTVDTVRNDLITGVVGGQTIVGGTGAGDNLVIQSSSNASKGSVTFQASTVIVPIGTAASPGLSLGAPGTLGWYQDVANSAMALSYGGAEAFLCNSNLVWMLGANAQVVLSVGGDTFMARSNATSSLNVATPGKFQLTPATPTNRTASTEYIGSDFNLSRTITWATGALATQREFLVRAPTYAFVGASIITTAATLAISGAPIQGANATISNPFALWVQTGTAAFDGGARTGTLQATDVVAFNPVASTSGTTTKFAVSPGADTGTTLTAEAIDVDFAFFRTRTWATGAIATQRSFVVRPPTLAFAGASTVTNAATMAIVGAPAAGANATITNRISLWVQAGVAQFDGNVYTPDVAGGPTGASNLNLRANGTGGPGTISFELGRATFSMVDTTIASAAGAVADLFKVVGSIVTISGATNVTTALGFNYAALFAPTYTTSVTIGAGGLIPAAATLAIKGPPTITGGGSFAGGIGAVGLWVQAPALGGTSAVFDGTVAIGTSAGSTAGLRMEGTGGITMSLATAPMLLSLAGTQTITKSNTGDFVVTCNTTGNFIFQAGAGNVEAFRILGTANAGQLQIAAANLAANGAVATAMTALGPVGSHTTIQEWLAIKGTGGNLRWIPMF